MTDHAARGDEAMAQSKPDDAIAHFSNALEQNPSAATWYIKRSTAYQRASRFPDALHDAETAVVLATKRASRELMADAQLRRAIALFKLERYGDASFVLGVVARLNPKAKTLDMWRAQCDARLAKLPADDDMRAVSVQEQPEVKVAQPPTTSTATTAAASQGSAAPSQTPAAKIRHDWYQSNESVTLSLLAKGVPKDQAVVDVKPASVSISFPLVSGSSYDFSIDPLYGAVDAARSTHRVLSTKIEVVLKKAQAGQKWPSLEGASNGQANDASDGFKSTSADSRQGPAYPTSSRSGPKNWDRIAQSFTKPSDAPNKAKDKDKDKENTSKPTESSEDVYLDDDADDVSDPANHFFQKLFQNADPDTRRAMMKSYQESGGTALNTNWAQVKDAQVPVQPPEGMEAKKWEY